MSKILDIIKTDSSFKLTTYKNQNVWLGKCIQCNRKLYILIDGTPISEATIEHIIPKNHGGGDNLENLAISCKNCNNFKGRTLDIQKRGHSTLEKVISSLSSKRMSRWRENT